MKTLVDSVRNFVDNSVWISIGNSVGNSVDNSVGNSVWNSVGSSVAVSLEKSGMLYLYHYIVGNVSTPVRASVWDSMKISVSDF